MTAFVYTALLGAWIACIYAVVTLRRSRRALKNAIRDQEFAAWAEWMILSVTSHDGEIFSATLRQIHREHITDQVWTSPIATALWYADPAIHADYQRRAEKIYGAVHTDQKDQTT